jgi:uncharacterized RDD family membrane protein YckC
MAKGDLVQPRIYGWLIDVLIFFGLGALFGALGWMASIGYWLLRDGLFEGQSVGKRLMNLTVVAGKERTRCTFATSALRNVLWVIPFVHLAMGFTGLHYLTSDPHGRHWGDRLADTTVVKA